MNIHYLQHVSFESPAWLFEWASQQKHKLTGIHLYSGEKLPSIEKVEGLIVMGGPMSVHDTDIFPWLSEEKELIKAAINMEKPLVGICLGAQIIADALGAEVSSMGYREIGWWPVQTPSGTEDTAFHWHGETFGLPAGAERLFSSTPCREQGFRFGDKCLALQFHLEMNHQAVKELIENCGEEIEDSLRKEHRHVQSAKTILNTLHELNLAGIRETMSELLNPLFQ